MVSGLLLKKQACGSSFQTCLYQLSSPKAGPEKVQPLEPQILKKNLAFLRVYNRRNQGLKLA